jgi:hypothetical protein
MAKLTGFRGGVLVALFALVIVTSGCGDYDMARRDPDDLIRGWSQGGELFTGAGVGGSRGKAVVMQADLPWEDSLTVQFNVSGPASGLIANTRAVISSSVQGNEIRRTITVVDGSSITVRGKTVRVTVRDHTVAALSSGVKYVVQVLATLGVRAAPAQPPVLAPLVVGAVAGGPYTSPILGSQLVVAGSSVFIQVPSDAGIVALQVQANGSGALIALGNLQVLQNTVGAGSQAIYEPREYDWVPLFPNVNEIQLNNQSADDARMSLMFGIDG